MRDDLVGRTDLAAERLEPDRQRPGQFTGAALRHRKTHGLAEHAHQDAHQPRARCIERDVGVAGVPGDQDPGRHPTEAHPSDVAGGREHGLDEAEAPDTPQAGQGGQSRLHGRERGQQGADDLVADPVPVRAQGQPVGPVPRMGVVHEPRRDLAVPVQDRPASVGKGMAERGRRVPPPQTVPFQAEGLDGR